MNEFDCRDWEHFEELLASFFKRSPRDRDMYVFRGQADSEWLLMSTLDRFVPLLRETDSEAVERELISEFVASAIPSLSDIADMNETATRVIARHHGVPSSLIDFTTSPYIAAFFACFDGVHDSKAAPGKIAIWALNRAMIPTEFGDQDFQFIDGVNAVRLNPRAVAQQALSLRVLKPGMSIYQLFPGRAMSKFMIPTKELGKIMGRLTYMNLRPDRLYGGLDGAAAFATWRVRTIHSKDPK